VSGLSLLLFLLLVGLELDFRAVGVWPWAPADVRGRLAVALGGHARLTCPSSSWSTCPCRCCAKIMPPAERSYDALLDAHGAALGGGLAMADAHHRDSVSTEPRTDT